MKKFGALSILLLLFSLVLIAGCGSKEQAQQAETPQAETGAPATEHPAAEHPAAVDSTAAAAGETQLAAHDCDGGCGMKEVPMDKLTVIDGKYYCAGCAKHMQQGDHSGHSH